MVLSKYLWVKGEQRKKEGFAATRLRGKVVSFSSLQLLGLWSRRKNFLSFHSSLPIPNILNKV